MDIDTNSHKHRVSDEVGTAVIHAMSAREKYLKGWWSRMTKSRASRAAAFEKWADSVESDDLREADTSALRSIAELAAKRHEVDEELAVAVREARRAGRSWSEIGAMLGVSKQAAQRKYGPISAVS